ncbi:MAG TPA: POTRA domain-containing protein, partial [Allocoleopsis sp.]
TGDTATVQCHFDPEVLAAVAKQAVLGELPPQESNTPENCPTVDGSDVVVDRPLSFPQLLQARSAITAYYTCRGYITSGALIPPQVMQGGVITIQVIEGNLESINVTGTRRLNPSYVRSRLRIASRPPVNINRLLEALQLLQLNPLIRNISAELQAGTRPGTNLLEVEVAEANSLSFPLSVDNNRVPSVGSFRQQIQVNQANLTGLGDNLNLSYAHTEGSNQFDGSYTLPLNPRNGTLNLAYGTSGSFVMNIAIIC